MDHSSHLPDTDAFATHFTFDGLPTITKLGGSLQDAQALADAQTPTVFALNGHYIHEEKALSHLECPEEMAAPEAAPPDDLPTAIASFSFDDIYHQVQYAQLAYGDLSLYWQMQVQASTMMG